MSLLNAIFPTDANNDYRGSRIAFWGISQLLFGLVFLLVVLRYRNLIPAMLLFIAVEYVARLASGQFKPIETVGQAPGGVANYIFPVVALVLLYLALPKRQG